jgi:hypothetical protein
MNWVSLKEKKPTKEGFYFCKVGSISLNSYYFIPQENEDIEEGFELDQYINKEDLPNLIWLNE